LGILQRSWN